MFPHKMITSGWLCLGLMRFEFEDYESTHWLSEVIIVFVVTNKVASCRCGILVLSRSAQSVVCSHCLLATAGHIFDRNTFETA